MLNDCLEGDRFLQVLYAKLYELVYDDFKLQGMRNIAQLILQSRFGTLSSDVLAALHSADEAAIEDAVRHCTADSLEQMHARLLISPQPPPAAPPTSYPNKFTPPRSLIMQPHLQERLFDAFPLLFAEHTLPDTASPMAWGITCGDGWFSLIWNLCQDLNTLIQQEPEAKRAEYRAAQVKEKFGSLRFYLRNATYASAMQQRIDQAEAESLTTCEVCGAPGNHYGPPGLWRARCPEHMDVWVS